MWGFAPGHPGVSRGPEGQEAAAEDRGLNRSLEFRLPPKMEQQQIIVRKMRGRSPAPAS